MGRNELTAGTTIEHGKTGYRKEITRVTENTVEYTDGSVDGTESMGRIEFGLKYIIGGNYAIVETDEGHDDTDETRTDGGDNEESDMFNDGEIHTTRTAIADIEIVRETHEGTGVKFKIDGMAHAKTKRTFRSLLAQHNYTPEGDQ